MSASEPRTYKGYVIPDDWPELEGDIDLKVHDLPHASASTGMFSFSSLSKLDFPPCIFGFPPNSLNPNLTNPSAPILSLTCLYY